MSSSQKGYVGFRKCSEIYALVVMGILWRDVPYIDSMRMAILCLIGCLLGLAEPASAQSLPWMNGPGAPEGFPISFSYYGNLVTHPGFKVGTERNIWYKEKVKKRSRRMPLKRRYLVTTLDAGWYIHPSSHEAVFFTPGLSYRKVREKGTRLEVGLHAGVLRTVLLGKTIEVGEGGAAYVKEAGRTYFQPQLSLGFGRELWRKGGLPLAWHVRSYLGILTPYNSGLVPTLNLEVGATYYFKFGKEAKR